jgi:glyoxylase-like metal-dependent hydrolase (beta-lactamase superfamily II)
MSDLYVIIINTPIAWQSRPAKTLLKRKLTVMKETEYSFNFKIGDFKCLVLRDTVSPMDLDLLISAIRGKELEDLLNKYDVPRGKVMDIMCLLIRMGKKIVLIDTGWGRGKQDGWGNIIPLLQHNGIKPEEIDTVINSHGHPDHIGGNANDKGKPLFPNARYIMFKKEWEFWTSLPDLGQIEKWVQQEMHAYVRKNLIPLRERFTLIDGETEFLPGIQFTWAPGHSPYHCVLNISSGNERLIYGSDLLHHPLQIARPEYGVFGDFNTEQARQTRIQFISQIVKNQTQLFACHFPFPGLGYICKNSDSLKWQPINITR